MQKKSITRRIECNPVTRRNFNSPKKIGERKEASAINLFCGRNFLDEYNTYKFKENETEADHTYPMTMDDNFVFPEPSKDGVIKIFDNWSALTKEQIECTCPFYTKEEGCLKAKEIGALRVEKKYVPSKRSSIKPIQAKTFKYSRASLLSANSDLTNFDDIISLYVKELKESNSEISSDNIEKELSFMYDVFLIKKEGIRININVPKTLDEMDADGLDFLNSLDDKTEEKPLTEEDKKTALISQLVKSGLSMDQILNLANKKQTQPEEDKTKETKEETKETINTVDIKTEVSNDNKTSSNFSLDIELPSLDI